MRSIFFLFAFFIFSAAVAQDTLQLAKPVDTLAAKTAAVDSLKKDSAYKAMLSTVPTFDSCRNYVIKKLVRLNLYGKPEFFIEKEKQVNDKDWLFYYILGLGFLFALLKLSYTRYFNDLFRVFFRTSLRVNQIREQLVQSGLQSLLYNIFFAVSAGTYVYLLGTWFNVSVKLPELLIPLIASAIIAVLYLGKYLFLNFSGWLFGMKNATEAYAFIVFLINKIIGVALLPFIVIIAFSGHQLAGIAITASLAMITGLFLYRFLRAYNPIQANLKVGRFHFFIFFLGFEIAPLLVIYKVLVQFI